MLSHVRSWLGVVGVVRFGWALLPMLLVSGLVLVFSSRSCARAVRSFDPLIDAPNGVGRSLSVYEPSRMEVVETAIDLLALGSRDTLIDIGSGDGRFVVAAARAGASAIGIERQGRLVERSRDNARMAGVAGRAEFVHADAMTLPSVVAGATVVTMFLTPAGFDVLVPWLEDVLRPGARVVSHTWPIPGWRPSRVVMVDDDAGGAWPIHVYRFPAADPYVRRAHGG